MKRRKDGKPGPKGRLRRDPRAFYRPLRPRKSRQRAAARMLVSGLITNAAVARAWSATPFGDVEKNVDFTSTVGKIEEAVRRVQGGDLSQPEGVLTAQLVTLNAMFASLAAWAHGSKYVDHVDRYLRLALKAQSQCRATCETLALLKNPPVFTRQANIASQQVVNNGTMVTDSRARESETAQNELLEAHGTRLVGREAGRAGDGHPAPAAVGSLNRPANSRG